MGALVFRVLRSQKADVTSLRLRFIDRTAWIRMRGGFQDGFGVVSR